MLTAIRLFFSTDLGKSIAVGLFTIAVLFGTYTAGSSHGYEKGFHAGAESRNEEVQTLNTKIEALTATINKQREAEAAKASDVAKSANEALLAGQEVQNQKVVERDEILRNFKAKPVDVQPSSVASSSSTATSGDSHADHDGVCIVGKDTVAALNDLLSTQLLYDPPN